VFDVLIAGGDVYDGSGAGSVPADVGVCGDRVAALGRGLPREAGTVIDAAGKAVCPGFINILSHSHLSILHDPRSLGELTQGVTTEVFGEGTSMGPLTPRLRAELERNSRGLDVEVSWTRLSEYLGHVERRGASQNVASFIGAGTLRAGAVGYSDRPATPSRAVTRYQHISHADPLIRSHCAFPGAKLALSGILPAQGMRRMRARPGLISARISPAPGPPGTLHAQPNFVAATSAYACLSAPSVPTAVAAVSAKVAWT
jgi:hypothetical protein